MQNPERFFEAMDVPVAQAMRDSVYIANVLNPDFFVMITATEKSAAGAMRDSHFVLDAKLELPSRRGSYEAGGIVRHFGLAFLRRFLFNLILCVGY